MDGPHVIRGAIDTAQVVAPVTPPGLREELRLLINDLEEASTTVFVRTAEAGPLVERCLASAKALRQAVDAQGWGDEAAAAFAEFERAVGKLRNTIMVRTQRAT